MQLSSSQIELLRSRPHTTKLYLSIFQPKPIFKARINDATIGFGSRIIIFNTVTLGSVTDIEAGMTLLIGSSDGARDVGKIRVKSASGVQIVVSENSNINWQNAQYLTVLKYWELWPVFPRIIQNANPEDVTFYKDYDVAYSNQNTVLGTIPCAGPHRAAFLDAGSAQLYYTATGSFNPVGAILSYDWTFEGGTPSTYNALTPGLVSYNAPGHYITRLTISGSNGGVDTTYRNVSIYDRPENGTGTVPLQYEIGNIEGSRGEGGYTASIKLHNPTGDIYDGALVVLFTDDVYGTTDISLGGNAQNSSKIFMVGYILKGSIRWNYADSYVDFDIGSITEVMKKTISFSISVESKVNPQYWFELKDLDVRRAIYHYSRWHSTLLSVADLQFLGQDFPIQYFDADRESLFDSLDNLMRGTLIGEVVSDRQGKIWFETSAEATPNSTGTFVQSMILDRRDWKGQPILEEEIEDDISFLELGGIAYSGPATGTFAPLMACAPGNAPSFRGILDRRQGLALASQTQLNQLVANLWANKNFKYKTVDVELAGDYRNLDIAPQETVLVNILPQDTIRRISLSQLYVPSSMSWNFDATAQFLYPRVSLASVVGGRASESIIIPAVPDGGGYGGRFPRIMLPSIPAFPGLITPAIQYIQAYLDPATTPVVSVTSVFSLTMDPTNTYTPSGTFYRFPSTVYGTYAIGITVSGWYRVGMNVSIYYSTPNNADDVDVYLTRNASRYVGIGGNFDFTVPGNFTVPRPFGYNSGDSFIAFFLANDELSIGVATSDSITVGGHVTVEFIRPA